MTPERKSSLVGVFGTPSTLTYWGIHVVRTIVGVVTGEYRFINGSYVDQFEGVLSNDPISQITICVSDCPEIRLCNAFIATDSPLLVFVEDPSSIIDDMVAVGRLDCLNALRLATRSLCAIQALLEAPGVIVLRGDCCDQPIDEFTDVMIDFLRLTATSDQRLQITHLLTGDNQASHLVRGSVDRHFPHFATRSHGAQTREVAAIKCIATCYEGLAEGHGMAHADWPAFIFSSGDKIGDQIDGPNELLGPARIIIYGPYMHLPIGEWSSHVEIEIVENRSGNRLKVDLVCGPKILVSASAEIPIMGHYCFSLSFTITEPLEPLELRFQIESGAIEGRFLLVRVIMGRRNTEAAQPADRQRAMRWERGGAALGYRRALRLPIESGRMDILGQERLEK